MLGIDVVMYNGAGCELDRETVTPTNTIEKIVSRWVNVIEAGDVIKFEETWHEE